MNESTRVQIERYLAGGMSPDETQRFLQSIRNDQDALAALGRALEDEAYLFDAIRSAQESEARSSRDTSRIVRPRRLTGRRTIDQGPAAGWVLGGIAAAAAILLIMASTDVRSKPPPKAPLAKLVPAPVAPDPEPPRPEPLRIPAPAPPPEAPRPAPAPMPIPPASEIPAPAPEAPAPARPKPAPTEVLPPPEAPKRALPVVAKIEQAAPGLFVVDAAGRQEARAGLGLVSGQGLESAAGGTIRFPDGTKLELAPDSAIREIVDEPAGGKRIVLAQGAVVGEISKQPLGKPMLFLTPQAQAKVLGTTLRLSIDGAATRLDVKEGKVQLKRLSDGKSVEVGGGGFAVAGEGVELAVRLNPIDEILIAPPLGEIGGTEWKLVRDPAALGGLAFEALRTSNRQPFTQTADAARVSFAFRADANRDYYVWVRGFAPSKVEPVKHDCVILEFPDARVAQPPSGNVGMAGGPERALYNGYMHGPGGYWWVGGDADERNDEQPVVVRFPRGGPQVLRLYASEAPIRIDAIWISATQKTRPAPQSGPGR